MKPSFFKKFVLVIMPVLFFATLGAYAAPLLAIDPVISLFVGAGVGLSLVLANHYVPLTAAGVLSLNYTNNIAARDTLRKSKEVLFNSMLDKFITKYGDNDSARTECLKWVDNRKWSQSELRLEVELNTTTSNFLFAVTNSDQNTTGVKFNTENRLDQQDTLVCSEYAIFLANPTSRTDTTFDLFSYANAVAFAAADLPSLRGTFFKQGFFYCTADKDVIIPYRGLLAHYNANQIQQTAALGAGSPQDQVRGAEDGFITDEPNMYVIGSKGYKPSIILPTALASLTNTFTRAVLLLRGNLAQNSTSIN